METRYKLDPGRSKFSVQVFVAGFLSFIGHSPTFAVRQFAGTIAFRDDLVAGMSLELTVRADSLAVTGNSTASDRQQIEERMRAEVLEVASYPEIAFRTVAVSADKLSPGRYRVTLDGQLALRGVSRPYSVDAELSLFKDAVELRGGGLVLMSNFGIAPVTTLGRTIRLKDEVRLSFDLIGVPEAGV